jgi:hypothetical protein
VRAIIGVIRFVCGLFALVLVLHIVLVLAGANFGNSFAQFIQDFAANVNLGLNTLFTFENDSIRIAVNEGLAALLWLIIGAGVSTLIARVAGGGTLVRRRYRV